MEKLYISPTQQIPEVYFCVEDSIFRMNGTSRPEDVRALYYPVIEWITTLADKILNGTITKYSAEDPIRFQIDLIYFNSSSAKFLYDIIMELNRISLSGVPVIVEWYYEKEDVDMVEAGHDFSSLIGMEFKYIQKEEE